MDNLRSINKDIYREVRNPLLKLFMVLAIERESYRDVFAQIVETSAINLMDFVTLACKYLDKDSLITILKKKLIHSINKGLLDGVPLMGLESSELSRAL
jgi:hypothetical protein